MRRCNCGSDILIGIICPSYCFAFPLYVYVNMMMIFVPMLFPSFSYALPLTHSLSYSVSPLASFLSPSLRFAYKPMANLFVLSLIAIKSSDKHNCFTQRAENNINLTPSPHSKDDQYWRGSTDYRVAVWNLFVIHSYTISLLNSSRTFTLRGSIFGLLFVHRQLLYLASSSLLRHH